MKESTRAVINEMVELQQWQKDNGAIDFKLDNHFKYSGKVEESYILADAIPNRLTKYEIYNLFNKNNSTKRGRAINCHLVNPSLSIVEVSRKLKITKETVKHALTDYYTYMRLTKHNK